MDPIGSVCEEKLKSVLFRIITQRTRGLSDRRVGETQVLASQDGRAGPVCGEGPGLELGGRQRRGGRGRRPREAALPAQPRALQPGRRPRPPLQPRRRGGVSRDEPAPFIQEVKATSGSMKTNGEPGGKETPGRGSASGRPAAVGLLSLWRSRPPRPGPGMCEPARRGPRAPHGARRPGL